MSAIGGTLVLPYSVTLLLAWAFLLGCWALGLPLGIQGTYVHPEPGGNAASSNPRDGCGEACPAAIAGPRAPAGGAALVPQRDFR